MIPYSEGGPTASDNLAPLCRRHHRLKTHGGWRYTQVERGTYLWTSPLGSASCATTRAPSTSPTTSPTGPVRACAHPPEP